ncbi:putative non-specific serine/threonine protein kinase [Helianthus anomalus]
MVFELAVQALMNIKNGLEDPHSVLNWDADAVDPCSWTMITFSPGEVQAKIFRVLFHRAEHRLEKAYQRMVKHKSLPCNIGLRQLIRDIVTGIIFTSIMENDCILKAKNPSSTGKYIVLI